MGGSDDTVVRATSRLQAATTATLAVLVSATTYGDVTVAAAGQLRRWQRRRIRGDGKVTHGDAATAAALGRRVDDGVDGDGGDGGNKGGVDCDGARGGRGLE